MPKTQPEEKLNTGDAAERLGVDESHIRRLARAGTLRGEKWGRDWQIYASSLAEYAKTPHPPGRRPQNRNGSERSVRP